jgi:alkanesulfonate monooxygenase SsuD/methylene tetrahydromethanopterin reductase-like flavin-dependent oxidoreductase (luciferase family)
MRASSEATRSEAKPNGGIRVGLRITPDFRELPRGLDRLPELAARAEAAGFDLFVVPERLSAQGGFPAALPVCAAAAAATKRLRIATGLLALPLHHPLRIAEDAATLDALSGGRFELGVGLGAEREAFGGFGLDRRERAARFEEALTVVRRAWADGPVSFSGQHFRCGEIEVFPKPVQAAGPPLWLGARGPDALVRAAQLGCGAVLEPETDAAPYLEAWGASGRDPGAARIALLLEPEHLAHPSLAQRIASAGASRVDLWLATTGDPAQLDELAGQMAVLRSL